MTLPESSNDFRPHDWSGDRGSIDHDPSMCQSCETLFWGHKSRMLCRKCEDDLRESHPHLHSCNQPVYAGDKLRRLVVWMLPVALVMWTIIYMIARVWILK